MIELTKKLPSKVSEKAKTTAEQLIDLGIEQGKKYVKNIFAQIAMFDISDDSDAKIVAETTKIPIEIVLLIDKINKSNKVEELDKKELIKQLRKYSGDFRKNVIANLLNEN
jgi:hypothetical protein